MHHCLDTFSSLQCCVTGRCSNQSPLTTTFDEFDFVQITLPEASDTRQGSWSFCSNPFINSSQNSRSVLESIHTFLTEIEKCQQPKFLTEIEKCQQLWSNPFINPSRKSRSVNNLLHGFRRERKRSLGFLVHLTPQLQPLFYFLKGVKSRFLFYFLNDRKSALGVFGFIDPNLTRLNVGATCMIPRCFFAHLLPWVVQVINSCYHCWNYADIQAMNVLPFRTTSPSFQSHIPCQATFDNTCTPQSSPLFWFLRMGSLDFACYLGG